MSPGTSLDPILHSHLVNHRRRSANDGSPLRSGEVTQVQHDALARVEKYLEFLKRVGHRELSRSIDRHRSSSLRGVTNGIAESTREVARGAPPPRRTRGMDIAKVALGQRPSFPIIDNEIQLDGSLADPSGWDNLLAQPAVRQALKPRLGGVGMIMDDGTTALGTGFVVAPHLVMTNRHVVERMFDWETTAGPPRFRVENARWLIHFSRDAGITTTATQSVRALITGLCFVTPEQIVVPTPAEAWQFSQVDLALLRIEPLKGAELPVVPTDWTTPLMTKPTILVVGHPCNNDEYRAKYDAERDGNSVSFDEVFGNQWQCKHASPGYGMPYFVLDRNEQQKDAGRFHPECGYIHDASTLGGNSGSPVLTLLGEHRAIGLHFWGQATTSPDQVANLAHVLGAVLDAPNLPTLRDQGSTLREVLAAWRVAGVDSTRSPIAQPVSRCEEVSSDQGGPGAVASESVQVGSEESIERAGRNNARRGKSSRSPQSH
ncbi:MAG: trypsin-like peptidase domain-containing protein [Planctomycetaceae bacterium]